MDLLIKRRRTEAWMNRFTETIGRDHFSSIKGFVVAGSIFDVINKPWFKIEQKKKNIS